MNWLIEVSFPKFFQLLSSLTTKFNYCNYLYWSWPSVRLLCWGISWGLLDGELLNKISIVKFSKWQESDYVVLSSSTVWIFNCFEFVHDSVESKWDFLWQNMLNTNVLTLILFTQRFLYCIKRYRLTWIPSKENDNDVSSTIKKNGMNSDIILSLQQVIMRKT